MEELDPAVKKQLEQALAELMPLVVEGAGGSVDPGAIEFWRQRYEAKFTNAILKKGRVYGEDHGKLAERARVLGRRARKLAGSEPITTQHAEDASDKTDCPEGLRMVDWCN